MNKAHYIEVISAFIAFSENETQENETILITKIDKLVYGLFDLTTHSSYYTDDEIKTVRNFLSENNAQLFKLLDKITNCDSLSNQAKEKCKQLKLAVITHPRV
jgi:hypothetical protein